MYSMWCYVYIYTYAYICTFTYTYMRMSFKHTYTCMYLHKLAPTHPHKHKYTHTNTHMSPKNKYNKTTNKLYSLICRQPKSPVEALSLLGPFCTQIGLFCKRKALVYTIDTPGHFFGNQPNFFTTKEPHRKDRARCQK